MSRDNENWIDDLDNKAGKRNGVDEHTKAFVLEGSPNEPLEKCEERESLKPNSLGFMAWRISRPLVILLISFVLLAFIGVNIYNHINENYFAPVSAEVAEAKNIEVKTGSSLSKIATLLYEKGIIRNKFVFQLYVDLNDMASSLQAGKYDLSPGMTMDEIIEILAKGDGGRQTLKVTFTEGSTIDDMAAKLVAVEMFDESKRDEFLALCNDAQAFEDYDFIAALSETAKLDGRKYLLEGYMFPDTYEFYMDAEPKDVIKRLLNRFDNIFTLQFEDKAAELGMSIDEVMTLASIIEWEALPRDFKKVSAVFVNRIEKEMLLNSCAAQGYVTGERKLTYNAEELKIDSPYNTYMYRGLPIGPIANPGQKAIEAALYPDEEHMSQGFLYFCNMDPETGELAWATNEKDHQKNVEAYKHLW